MKKILVFVLLSILIIKLALPLASAQDTSASFEQTVEKLGELQKQADTYRSKDFWVQKWDYLGKEWKNILLKNKFTSAIDSFFTKISFLFLILFAKPYSMSLILAGIIFLWLFVFLNGGNLIRAWGIVGEGFLPYLASFVVAVGIAWTTAFENIIILLGKLAFSPEHWWTRILVVLFIIMGFVFLQCVDALLNKFLMVRRETLKKKSAELAQNWIQKFFEKMSKGSRKN